MIARKKIKIININFFHLNILLIKVSFKNQRRRLLSIIFVTITTFHHQLVFTGCVVSLERHHAATCTQLALGCLIGLVLITLLLLHLLDQCLFAIFKISSRPSFRLGLGWLVVCIFHLNVLAHGSFLLLAFFKLGEFIFSIQKGVVLLQLKHGVLIEIDFKLEVFKMLLQLRFHQLLRGLHDLEEVFLDLSWLKQPLFVAVVEFKQLQEPFFCEFQLRKAKSSVAPLDGV